MCMCQVILRPRHRRVLLGRENFEYPPSVIEINAHDSDGSFDEVASHGHAEVSFLKYNTSELAEDYLDKVEKEVGKKNAVRSPHTNLAFQKIFFFATRRIS
ncbi:hypothetical protein BS78_02G211600 [Paspalum vaginatum]|nr:hypothetical protein BS78_02G211600 [Paspalum vaginatum]